MVHKPVDLATARVLISNDDGIGAPGIKVLEKIIRAIAGEVWVVAPETEQSAASHSLTLRSPLRVKKISGRRYAVNGTPTDSVLLGIKEVLKDFPPDLVVSGINRGGNLGEDITYSGTVAAAMEATLLGCPAIAISQVTNDRHAPRWATSEHWIPIVLEQITRLSLPKNTLINVNIPDVVASRVTGIEITSQGKRKIGGALTEGIDPRGDTYFWVGPQRVEDRYLEGSDLEATTRGAVSVTPLSMDLTNRPMLKVLKEAFR